MPLKNYRELPLILNGRQIRIGGFARPDGEDVFLTLKNEHHVNAVISLTGNYSNMYNKAGLAPGFYTQGDRVNVFDWYDTPYHNTTRIEPKVYDAVYEAVTQSQNAGNKIAIHCGAGDGRTGTALSSLMLRELLESDYARQAEGFNNVQAKSQIIHMHHGVNGTAGGDVHVTPFVKRAIEEVRRRSNHMTSVESRNDVESLMLYERHLRAQLSHQNVMGAEHPKLEVVDELPEDPLFEAQVNAAVNAVENGNPQVKESFVSRLIEGISNLWERIKEAVHDIKESIKMWIK